MFNAQQKTKKQRILSPIKNIKQLVSSYYVAKAIIEIRKRKEKEIKNKLKEKIPVPDIPQDSPFLPLYKDFCSLVNYNSIFCCVAQIAIENIYKYHFENSESVTTVLGETEHLNDILGKNFKKLRKITLFEHTLNVFTEAIKKGTIKKRTLQIGIPILSALLHDFGKSKDIRIKLLGSVNGTRGAGYRPHAEVSGLYVEEMLSQELFKRYKISPVETLETLEIVVKNHHSTSKKAMEDKIIQFVRECDIAARKKELRKIAMEEAEQSAEE